jgi:hypothetical protein
MRVDRLRAIFLGLAALALISATMAPAVSAQNATPPVASAPAFVLAPKTGKTPYFTLTIKPGETQTLTVDLGNAGDDPVTARTYAANAYSLVNGGFGVRPESDPATGTTTWLDYPAATLTLKPKTLIERSFTVTAPKDAKPGQYLTGLVIQTAEPIAVPGSDMLKQIILKSIAVFITIPGATTPKLTIGQAAIRPVPSATIISIEIVNAGNVLLKPAGSAVVTDASGQTVTTVPIVMDSVYAGLTTTIELPLATDVSPGVYHVALNLKDEATGAKAAATVSVTVAGAVATSAPKPVTISALTLDPARDAAGKLRYVTVTATIANTGEPVANARLTLHVTLDGKPVEDFPMSAALSVPTGTTTVPARYLPAGDWASGKYGFSVTLDAVDPGTGQTTTLVTANAPETVTGP